MKVEQLQFALAKLTVEERQAFKLAMRNSFCVERRRPNLGNAYWRYCSFRNVPYVVVRHQGKYARVRLDMWACDFDLSNEGIREAARLIHQYSRRPYSFELGRNICSSYRVPCNLAPELARELRRLATDPSNTARYGTLPEFTREQWTAAVHDAATC